MARRTLITGGAGFIGSHLVDELLAQGGEVVVLDCLLPEVHGEDRARPSYLDPHVELRVGEIEDAGAVRDALEGEREVLVAEDGAELAGLLDGLTPDRSRRIGAAARARVLAEHTYRHRASEADRLLTGG